LGQGKYDAFFSYATEETQLAHEIVGGLRSRGLKIWYAPLNLKIGDMLLDSIERAIVESRASILLISKAYLCKGWTNYEMDILVRHQLEKKIKILPIWHGVSKEEVETRHVGLSGIYAIQSNVEFYSLINQLVEVLGVNAPTVGVIPSYENPKWRFLQGRGEITIGSGNGPATTLWEFLLHTEDSGYPFFLEGEIFSKNDLLFRAAQLLPNIPDEVDRWVGKKGREDIWEMCKRAGFDQEKLT
jgi:hypothetical protein